MQLSVTGKRKVVLVGNPNVGKSIFFGYLSKQYTMVSNYPGTTVDLTQAKWGEDALIDTPGIYSVSSNNDEEKVARDIILEADIIVNIVDAVRLERDLFVTQQLIDMGKTMIVVVNFMDEAKKNGLKISVNKLSQILGVPVIPSVAKDGLGLSEVEKSIIKAKEGNRSEELKSQLDSLLDKVASHSEALMFLEGDPEILERYQLDNPNLKDQIYSERRQHVNEIVSKVIKKISSKVPFSEKIGRWSLEPLRGTVILAMVISLLYLVVGKLIAGNVVDFTEGEIMSNYWTPFVQDLLAGILDNENALYVVLAGDVSNQFGGDDFGLLTMTITYLVGLLLPLVIGFYFMLGILEDSGYLPRLATFVDRLLTKIGLNGRAVIPLILGFGCVQLGTISTRLLGTNREKRIAATILNFTTPCSAQLGVITVMLAGVSGGLIILYVGVIFGLMVLIGTIMNKILPGKSLPLMIDLPPMRLPQLMNILYKVRTRSVHFLKEATPWFFFGAFIIAVLQVTGGLVFWQKMWGPITKVWLDLPEESATAFIMGMIRRDFGAAGLMNLPLNDYEKIVSLVVITLFVPCIASFMILLKERGIKEGLLIWFGALGLAFLMGGILAQLVMPLIQ